MQTEIRVGMEPKQEAFEDAARNVRLDLKAWNSE